MDSETAALTPDRSARRSVGDRLAGTLCPGARVAGERFDDLNRDGLTLVSTHPVAQDLAALIAGTGGAVVEVGREHELGRG